MGPYVVTTPVIPAYVLGTMPDIYPDSVERRLRRMRQRRHDSNGEE